MKRLSVILCFGIITALNAGVLKVEKQVAVSHKYTKSFDESIKNDNATTLIRYNRSMRSPQNPNVTAVLIDSSVHGYGMVVPQTSPTTYIYGKGFVIGYRGWVLPPYTDGQGNVSSANNSGFIKTAISQDGINFTNYSGLNGKIMGPNTQVMDGPLQSRYPSSVADEDYHYIVWTEAISYTGNATNNSGRPMYTYDEFGWYSGSYFQPAIDINFDWYNGSDPTNAPGDMWVNSPVLVDDGINKAMVVTSTQWSSTPNENFPNKSTYVMRSTVNFSGNYQFYNLPELMFNQNDFVETGTTSQTSMDINSNGVGYAMCTAYLSDSLISERHNFMIRKTTDYGVTWSTDGMNNYDFYIIPDTTMHRLFVESGLLPDTLLFFDPENTTSFDTVMSPGVFPLYDHEVRVDSDGTLHIFTTMVIESDQPGSIYTAVTGVGLFHLWTDDPSNPGSWRVSQIAELSSTFGLNGMPDGSGGGNYFNVFGTSAISNQNDNIFWVGYHALGDTSAAGFNWDIFVSKSLDGGVSWSEPDNVTMTSGLQEDELYVHLAPAATDSNCFMVYYQPDYSQNHLDDPENMASFQQNLWFITYGNTITVGIDDEKSLPGSFALKQNYPNPFNPVTSIAFSVNKTGVVDLALYNILGQHVQTLVNEIKQPGEYSFELNASDLAGGLYFYRMTQHGNIQTRKLVLLK